MEDSTFQAEVTSMYKGHEAIKSLVNLGLERRLEFTKCSGANGDDEARKTGGG